MKTNFTMIATMILTPLTLSGCKREPPVLTDRQVEQVFDAQQRVLDQQEILSQGRDELEADRRHWSERERSDPIIAKSIEAAGILFACCLPLALILLLLAKSKSEQVEEAKADPVLVEMLSTESKRLPQTPPRSDQANLPHH
ncbi:hypothetical protein CKO51_28245 [Rhodopirellula sp. SM50]|nr:hypothetical protein [Rhodopirellula sp. SM50]PAY16099.1 hypothetical protein CKO51_28245 [Rhodopirellula sp. SM50]